ncbi:MAG: CDGSH iron-sulfur domain-containing protein, partial [Phycisphaerales bacterium]|nr:CDGSH iron-sulfur domain-containing protein [Phycisphaerales bacterium]
QQTGGTPVPPSGAPMPRLIPHDATGPVRIDPQDRPVFICACGLSQNLPHCDGRHNLCAAEQEGKVYVYAEDRNTVVEVREEG